MLGGWGLWGWGGYLVILRDGWVGGEVGDDLLGGSLSIDQVLLQLAQVHERLAADELVQLARNLNVHRQLRQLLPAVRAKWASCISNTMAVRNLLCMALDLLQDSYFSQCLSTICQTFLCSALRQEFLRVLFNAYMSSTWRYLNSSIRALGALTESRPNILRKAGFPK